MIVLSTQHHFDIDLSQPLGYTKAINFKQAKNNLNIAKLSFYSTQSKMFYLKQVELIILF